MKRAIVILALCALPARGEEQPQLALRVLHALTPIDSVPTKDDITNVIPTDTFDQLAEIARVYKDVGVRLRAIRALPQFCTEPCAGTPPHQLLVTLLATPPVVSSEQSGNGILVLRATIEALGATRSRDATDVSRLATYLEHPSRDIRVAAVFALRDLCHPAAKAFLTQRYAIETVQQVRMVISDALRGLETCGN